MKSGTSKLSIVEEKCLENFRSLMASIVVNAKPVVNLPSGPEACNSSVPEMRQALDLILYQRRA